MNHFKGILSTAPHFSAVLFFALSPAMGQSPAEPDVDAQAEAARAERNARRFERDARVLTMFDRDGNVLTTVGERGLYRWPVLSPDGTRLVVGRWDLGNETLDLWVIDIETGVESRITSHAKRNEEWASTAVWSPDGTELAYVGLRAGFEGVYRKSSNGAGREELLYRDPGGDLNIGDWSMDGRYLSLSASDGFFSGSLFALPMEGEGERAPIEIFRGESQLFAGSFSEDGRWLSYRSDATGRDEVYVLRFDPPADAQSASTPSTWRISTNGGEGPVRSGWRRDGGEFYYLAADRGIMAAQVDTDSTFELRHSELVFRPSQAIRFDTSHITVSRDGKRILIAVPHAPTLEQITLFDRRGNVMRELGAPGRYRNPTLSPDGRKVAVTRTDADTNTVDIWTFDVASGVGTAVTNDEPDENWAIWSPDGSELLYGARPDLYSIIYRAAADGTGEPEQVYQFTPGAFLEVTDWSSDGRFMTFQDGCWGVLHVVPLAGQRSGGEPRAIEWLRDEYQVAQARISPDGRYIAYLSDELVPEEFRIYVAPFDPRLPDGGRGAAPPIAVVADPVEGMVTWREDGKELYYVTSDWEVMAVDVMTTPGFQAGTPRLLFALPGPSPGNPKQWKSVSADGERFVFVVNVPVSVP